MPTWLIVAALVVVAIDGLTSSLYHWQPTIGDSFRSMMTCTWYLLFKRVVKLATVAGRAPFHGRPGQAGSNHPTVQPNAGLPAPKMLKVLKMGDGTSSNAPAACMRLLVSPADTYLQFSAEIHVSILTLTSDIGFPLLTFIAKDDTTTMTDLLRMAISNHQSRQKCHFPASRWFFLHFLRA